MQPAPVADGSHGRHAGQVRRCDDAARGVVGLVESPATARCLSRGLRGPRGSASFFSSARGKLPGCRLRHEFGAKGNALVKSGFWPIQGSALRSRAAAGLESEAAARGWGALPERDPYLRTVDGPGPSSDDRPGVIDFYTGSPSCWRHRPGIRNLLLPIPIRRTVLCPESNFARNQRSPRNPRPSASSAIRSFLLCDDDGPALISAPLAVARGR